jgi:hypothetical protein
MPSPKPAARADSPQPAASHPRAPKYPQTCHFLLKPAFPPFSSNQTHVPICPTHPNPIAPVPNKPTIPPPALLRVLRALRGSIQSPSTR